MPLAEAVIVGAAVGLACSGLVPVPELQFLGFGSQAFHQIEGQVARMRFRSNGGYPMPMVIRAPFGGNVRTPELHSDSHEAKYVNAPGLKIAMPATARDAKGMLAAALRDPDPVLFFEPLRGYRLIKDEVPEEDFTVAARAGADGAGGHRPRDRHLQRRRRRSPRRPPSGRAAEGYSVGVLDLRSLVPLDVDALREAVAGCGRALVLHEGSLSAGFGAELVATIQEEAFWSLEAPVRPRRGARHAVPARARSRTATCPRSSASSPRSAPRWRPEVARSSSGCPTWARASRPPTSASGWWPRATPSPSTRTSSRSRPTRRWS